MNLPREILSSTTLPSSVGYGRYRYLRTPPGCGSLHLPIAAVRIRRIYRRSGTSERSRAVNGMVWVRVLVGAVWLNGAVEKLLNPEFPQQFAASLEAGGFVSQAPPFFRAFMQGYVVPNAELFAQLMRVGELALGIALILGLLTNLAAIGSALLSLAIMLSQGGVRLGTGLGAPELLTINVLVALISVVILLSPAAKALSIDAVLARRRPGLSPLLTNRRHESRP
jgi:thiosulfate dehydrogenase [quinone] large subunit